MDPVVVQTTNGDETKYTNYIGSYSKCLDHNDLGEVITSAYEALVRAISDCQIVDFERLYTGAALRIAGPLGGKAFDLLGPDAEAIIVSPPPSFDSTRMAAEMVELYWMALTRDIPFAAYNDSPLIESAARDLSHLYRSVLQDGTAAISPANLFLAPYPGVSEGPRVSQLLLWSYDFDGIPLDQRRSVPLSVSEQNGLEFLTSYDEWLAAQRGFPKGTSFSDPPMDKQLRYVISSRDMGWCADQSSINTTYLCAGLLLSQFGRIALSEANPYKSTHVLGGLGSFDIAHLERLLGFASQAHQFCYQKWLHRRLRPEAFSGRVHNHVVGKSSYPIHESLITSPVLPMIYDHNALVNQRRGLDASKGTYLLPCLWGEGCPTHPSYPQGHGTAAGIGVTLLKAWFAEEFVLPESVTVRPSSDGTRLEPYRYGYDGPPLTIGGELNKLAYNITWGRNMSGIHYRSDGIAANLLGEEIAIRILREDREMFREPFKGFSFTRFDGTKVKT